VTLTNVEVMPYGGAAVGFPWDDKAFTGAPGWAFRQRPPAHLHYIPQSN
jgi:hypothetical protein